MYQSNSKNLHTIKILMYRIILKDYQQWLSLGGEFLNWFSFILCVLSFTMNIYFFCNVKKKKKKGSVKPTIFRAPQALAIMPHVPLLVYVESLVEFGPEISFPTSTSHKQNPTGTLFPLNWPIAKAMTMTLQALVNMYICSHINLSSWAFNTCIASVVYKLSPGIHWAAAGELKKESNIS